MLDLFNSGENIFLFLVKVGIILFLFVYVIFAGVVIKQVRMMTDTLDVGFETSIKFIVLMHFIFSIFVLILAFVLL